MAAKPRLLKKALTRMKEAIMGVSISGRPKEF
jgi:hypothetical protein